MTDVKLNGMRELSFKEIEDVSGGVVWFLTPWVARTIAGVTGTAFLARIASDNGWFGDGPRGPTPPAVPSRR